MFELTIYGKGLIASIPEGRPVPLEKGGETYNLRNLTQAQMEKLYSPGSAIIQKVAASPPKSIPKPDKKEIPLDTPEDVGK